ncbi:hypothetical protein KAX08_08325 [candidate division WOR-3 bacterium]|nr:hypothetical protein [candidate division WOR-3 bacterium]
MRLKRATLLAIIGISYAFALRTIGTFLPDIFRNLIVVQFTQIMAFLASLTIVFFFISFYIDYVQKHQINLRNVSILAIIGTSAMSLLHIKGLLRVFNIYIFPNLVYESHYIEAIIPLVSSIFILLFFIFFHKETLRKEDIKLGKATLSAIIGSSIGTLERTFVLFNYFYSREVRWFSDLSRKIQIIFIPIFVFSFIAILYFFLSFYKEQR